MDTLYIYRSKPDQVASKLLEPLLKEANASIIKLYQDNIDWKEVVKSIFHHNKVICWW